MIRNRKIRPPFFEIGPKNYLVGDEVLELAKIVDKTAAKYDMDVIFTCPYTEIRRVSENTENIHISAPHMDPLEPGRGLAFILPEAVKAAGAQVVTLNHCERRLTFNCLEKTVKRAKEIGLYTIICADSIAEIQAVAHLAPDIIIAEPDELIGTGSGGDVSYVPKAVQAVKDINPDIYVLVGAGINSGNDVYNVVSAGCDASGTSSGIVRAADRAQMADEMISSCLRAWKERNG